MSAYTEEIRTVFAQTPPALREQWADAIEAEANGEANQATLHGGYPAPYTDDFRQGFAAGIWFATFLLRGGDAADPERSNR